VLVVAAALVSLGPGTLVELVSGLFFVRPPAASIVIPPSHTDAELQARLAGVASSLQRGRLAAVAIDLRTGASASIDADRAYASASLFKLPILLSVLAQEDTGALDPNRPVEIRPEDWTDGSGKLQARVGDSLAVRELTRRMIQDSDNMAALVLLDLVGAADVNATAERLGLQRTRLVDHRAGETGEHTTSAADMAHLLVGLASGQAVSPRVSEQALGFLELKQNVSWLGDELPFWVKVAHKWGDLPAARNDVGVIYTPRGSYVMAVLTENSPAEESAGAIARASRVMYDYLGNR
jgi:beta-lactamase class A